MACLTKIRSATIKASGFDVEEIKGIRSGEIECMAQEGSAPVNIEVWDDLDEKENEWRGNTELCLTIEEAETLHDILGKVIAYAKEINK